MRLLIVSLLIFGVAATEVLTQPQTVSATRLVLKITEVEVAGPTAPVRIRLESGQVLTVSISDVDWGQSSNVQRDVNVGNQAPATPTGSPAASVPNIRAKCAKDWPDDFSMRAFCEKQQAESQSKLGARPMTTSDQRTIREKCSRDWPDDFTMRNFCEEQQLKALGSLR